MEIKNDLSESGGGVQSGIMDLVGTFLGELIGWHLADIGLGIQSLLRQRWYKDNY